MKIIVTGGAGFIGSHTVVELINNGFEPVIIDDFRNAEPFIVNQIEKITGKNLEPTYTYTSFYVKDADLPSHTDRKECQYTVSFVVDKPENASWNIYVDPKNQPVKNKGRCSALSVRDDCIAVDCDANGLMIFCGEDHAHFREKLEYDYYNILLLHYVERK